MSALMAVFQLYYGEKKVNFQCDDGEVRFVLDQHVEFDFYSASWLKRQDRRVAPLSWFRVNQFLLFLLNAACLAENTFLIYQLKVICWYHTAYSNLFIVLIFVPLLSCFVLEVHVVFNEQQTYPTVGTVLKFNREIE